MIDKKKLPHTINDEELLSILEDVNNLEVVEKPEEHSVPKFLAEFSIYPGTERVYGALLYKLYHKVTESPVANVEFHLLMSGYLQHEQKSNRIYYYTNRNAVELTKKTADLLQKRKYNKKVVKKHYRKHFENFLQRHFIKTGIDKVSSGFLFFFYDKWCYNERRKKNNLTYNDFCAMLRVYFKSFRTGKDWCVVQIDKKEFTKQYTEEQIKTALDWAEKFNKYGERKKGRKKKQKIEKSLPGTET